MIILDTNIAHHILSSVKGCKHLRILLKEIMEDIYVRRRKNQYRRSFEEPGGSKSNQ
jgi:hypothetical protein